MKVVEDISGWRFFQYILRWLIPFHLQFQNGVEVIISHSLYEGLFLFVDNIRHLDRMRLLTEQEQIFSDKISVFRFDPAILGCFKLVRYGFLYLFDNLFVFPDTHVLSHFLQIFHREIVLFAIEWQLVTVRPFAARCVWVAEVVCRRQFPLPLFILFWT